VQFRTARSFLNNLFYHDQAPSSEGIWLKDDQ